MCTTSSSFYFTNQKMVGLSFSYHYVFDIYVGSRKNDTFKGLFVDEIEEVGSKQQGQNDVNIEN